ncbi:hypothetical protein AN216_20750 [Streptomyces oceani]|uniref:Histidine kinase/HSP90-like ATPase domain-containing protein n=1 Tax=Streptomyces oceani TaxID=1075402 RepID=A0A1E7JXM4_9ACTN|nr:hypothetical protein AN216_20750 [Streptomyces oceani]
MTLPLLALPCAVAELRHQVGAELDRRGLPGLVDTAELCVSELVTNVIRHVGEGVPISLRLVRHVVRHEDRLRIELTDPCPRVLPMLLSASAEQEYGRGLALVDALAACWGVIPHKDSKTTWCELAATPAWRP